MSILMLDALTRRSLRRDINDIPQLRRPPASRKILYVGSFHREIHYRDSRTQSQQDVTEHLVVERTCFLVVKEPHLGNTSVSSVTSLAEQSIGYYETKKKKPWFDEDCCMVVERRKQAKLKFLQDPVEEKRDNYFNERREASRTLRKKRENGYQPRVNVIKDENGDLLADSPSILNRWKNYFAQLLNVHRPNRNDRDEIEIQTAEPFIPEPTLSEVEIAIENLKSTSLQQSICGYICARQKFYTTRCLHPGCNEVTCWDSVEKRSSCATIDRIGIADVLKRRGWEVHEEIHCVSSLDSNRKADIVAIHRTQSKGIVLDPTFRFERDALQAHHVDEEKKSIYEFCIPCLSEKYNIPTSQWSVPGLLFGARGTLPKFTCAAERTGTASSTVLSLYNFSRRLRPDGVRTYPRLQKKNEVPAEKGFLRISLLHGSHIGLDQKWPPPKPRCASECTLCLSNSLQRFLPSRCEDREVGRGFTLRYQAYTRRGGSDNQFKQSRSPHGDARSCSGSDVTLPNSDPTLDCDALCTNPERLYGNRISLSDVGFCSRWGVWRAQRPWCKDQITTRIVTRLFVKLSFVYGARG
ncbi:hypothetical protein ANN_10363 [Periplaneta americana]|uniref:Uncharacterized protein n=1 Tax=Periplaneta americana TaxID=6978 RepID=A0ABQ8TNS8_PERAM|nr:hypothetical protein ANN_10363 [Periplaneta americana]